MKVITYKRVSPIGTIKRLGVLLEKNLVLDVHLVATLHFEKLGYYNPRERAEIFYPSSLSRFLKTHQNHSIEKLQEILALYHAFLKEGHLKTADGADVIFPLNSETTLSCPLDEIGMYRDFYAHEKHVKKGFEKRNEPVPQAWYEIPAYYKGGNLGFIGPDEIIPWPHYSKVLDYELELATIISRDGKNIKAKDAKSFIFGFTVLNDISARDIQKKEMSIRLGPAKGKDWCSILGPVITTFDEFNYQEPNLLMTAHVNGQEWSRGYSGEAHYTWAQMIEHLTMEEWMRAGDVLGSGTVGTGCGLELDQWIKAGDLLELTIDKIGTLKNIVGTPTQP